MSENKLKSKPFVDWSDGNETMLKFLIEILPPIDSYSGYCEPFVGGGSLFFKLSNLGVLDDKFACIIDHNTELINAYRCIKYNPTSTLMYLKKYEKKISKKKYEEVCKPDMLKKRNTERAAILIYLNKLGYGGIHKRNNNGKYITPYHNPGDRKIKIYDRATIEDCSRALANVVIGLEHQGVSPSPMHTLISWIGTVDNQDKVFFFFDPPHADRYNQIVYINKIHNYLSVFCSWANKAGHKFLILLSGQEENKKKYYGYNFLDIDGKNTFGQFIKNY